MFFSRFPVSVVFKAVPVHSQIPSQWKQASFEDVTRYPYQARAAATTLCGGYGLTDGIFYGPGRNYQLTQHDPVDMNVTQHILLIKGNLKNKKRK